MKKTTTILLLLVLTTIVNAQYWTELSYFDGTTKGVNQILSFNEKVYCLYNEAGKVKLGISSDGQNFTSVDAPTGSAAAGWIVTSNGILINTKSNSSAPIHQDIVMADLKQSNVSFTVLTRANYDPNSQISSFYPSSKTSGTNGDIWLGTMVSYDDGATWKNISSPNAPNAIAPNGDLILIQSNGKLYTSIDTAKKWTLTISNGTWKSPNNLYYIDAQTMLVLTGDYPVYSDNGGTSWTSLNGGLPLGNWFGTLSSASETYIYHTSKIYVLKSGQSTWTNIGTQFTVSNAVSGLVETKDGTFFAAVSGKLYINITVGIGESRNNSTGIDVFPNPSTGEFNLSLNPIEIKNLTLTDVTGKLITEEAFTNKLSIADAPAGVYFLRIGYTNGQLATQKLVKY